MIVQSWTVTPANLRTAAAVLLWSGLAFAVVGWAACLLGSSDDGLHCLWAAYGMAGLVLGGGAAVALRALADRRERR